MAIDYLSCYKLHVVVVKCVGCLDMREVGIKLLREMPDFCIIAVCSSRHFAATASFELLRGPKMNGSRYQKGKLFQQG